MSNLRTRIAAVLSGHRIDTGLITLRCSCLPDAWLASWEDCELHLADAVIRELNLERQDHYDPHCDYYRYVTDWIAPND